MQWRRYEEAFRDRSFDWEAPAITSRYSAVQDGAQGAFSIGSGFRAVLMYLPLSLGQQRYHRRQRRERFLNSHPHKKQSRCLCEAKPVYHSLQHRVALPLEN